MYTTNNTNMFGALHSHTNTSKEMCVLQLTIMKKIFKTGHMTSACTVNMRTSKINACT